MIGAAQEVETMGKARMCGMFATCVPNSKADMRYRRKMYNRCKDIEDRQQIAGAERADRRGHLKECDDLERMKKGAGNG